LLTTLAATKVYRMPQGKAVQQVRIELMPGAIFEYVPEAAILFADADYEQQIDIVLHEGAVLIFQDAIMAGRRASGEDLRFRRLLNRITVRDDQGLLLHERQDIRPGAGDLDRLGLLEGYRCWASWYVLGDLLHRGIDLESLSAGLAAGAEENGPVLWSASRLQRGGLLVRLVSGYWSALAQPLECLRATFRRDNLRLPAPRLRK
jgi:urease accessory protein